MVQGARSNRPQSQRLLPRFPPHQRQNRRTVHLAAEKGEERTLQISILGQDLRLQSLSNEVREEHQRARLLELHGSLPEPCAELDFQRQKDPTAQHRGERCHHNAGLAFGEAR